MRRTITSATPLRGARPTCDLLGVWTRESETQPLALSRPSDAKSLPTKTNQQATKDRATRSSQARPSDHESPTSHDWRSSPQQYNQVAYDQLDEYHHNQLRPCHHQVAAASALGSTPTRRTISAACQDGGEALIHGTRHRCGTDRPERGSQPEPDGPPLARHAGQTDKAGPRSSGDRASVS
jgi:hypothetical protein